MPVRRVVRKSPTKVTRLTIRDNFERFERHARAIGATDADLAPLLEKVAEIERLENHQAQVDHANPALLNADLADLTAPYTCACGWIIQPPSPLARRWAAHAILRVTGGAAAVDSLGLAFSMLAGLWTLKQWGDGRKAAVMQSVCSPDLLAEILPGLMDAVGETWDTDAAASDYMRLMGMRRTPEVESDDPKKKASGLSRLRGNCSAPSMPGSSETQPAPSDGSGSTGQHTATRPPRSRTRSSGKPGRCTPKKIEPYAEFRNRSQKVKNLTPRGMTTSSSRSPSTPPSASAMPPVTPNP